MEKSFGYSATPSDTAVSNLLYADGMGCIADEPFFNIKRNFYPDYLIMHCEKGVLQIQKDNIPLQLSAGQSCLMNLMRPHYYYSSQDNPCKLWWIDFNGKPIHQLEQTLFLHNDFIIYDSIKTAERIRECIDLFKNREQNWEYEMSGVLYKIVMEAFGVLQERSGENNLAKHLFIRTLDRFIDSRLDSKITLEDLSGLFHLDPSYLCRKTKKLCNMSPMEYVINKKIQTAKYRLLYTSDSLKSISLSLGFYDQNHFSYVFYKHTGLYPSAYRKENKEFILKNNQITKKSSW